MPYQNCKESLHNVLRLTDYVFQKSGIAIGKVLICNIIVIYKLIYNNRYNNNEIKYK